MPNTIVPQKYGNLYPAVKMEMGLIELDFSLVTIAMEEKLQHFYKKINCRIVDHISICDNENNFILEFIVDDEGLLKNNFIYEVSATVSGETHKAHIAGNFIIAQTIETEEGMDFAGFSNIEQIKDVLIKYDVKIKLLGFRRCNN